MAAMNHAREQAGCPVPEAPDELPRLADLVMELGGGSYVAVRVLDDGTIAALGDLMYTRAIFLDCEPLGWGRRFCFEDRALATQRFYELKSADDEPAGWTARRPQQPCDYGLPPVSTPKRS